MRPPSGRAAITLACGFSVELTGFLRGLSSENSRGDAPAGRTAVTKMRADQVRNFLCAGFESLEKQLSTCGVFLVRRIPQQFDPLLLRSFFFIRAARKIKMFKRIPVVVAQAVQEGVLAVHPM